METLASIIESILFISGKEVAVKDISEKLEITNKEVLNAAKKLQEKYGEDSGINLIIFNNKLQFCSNPKNGESVEIVLNPIKERELSKSMLEVSAIVAYKQPVTRLDIEEIRGANSEYAIQNLLKNGIIEIVGRKDTIGKPVLFGTGDNFLKRFQIEELTDLPDYDDLMAKIKLIHASDDDSYLFKKDEYNADNDPEYAPENLFGDENNFENTSNAVPTLDEEEIPDFLKDEQVDIIA